MRNVYKTVYLFNELSDEAKKNAREWYRHGCLNYEWWDCVYDDAKTIASLFGLSIDEIRFSGFWSQGDGASFTGSYNYKKGGLKAVMSYAPNDEWLHAIVKKLQDLQRKHFYRLGASIRQSGLYVHEKSMSIDMTYKGDGFWRADGISADNWQDAEKELTEIMRDYARLIYRMLEREYEFITSDENIDESLIVNEYEFTENGKIY